jgi:REP-associated tyrosine transposase
MYWRRRLPHWVPDNVEVFVTWRLAGAMVSPKNGSFAAWLAHPRIASIVVEALLHGQNSRQFYDLLSWVVMPDHIHMVILPKCPLPEIMRWLKAATANRVNRLLGRRGQAFWHREYFDRWIRSDEQLQSAIAYVEDNPVRKGLAMCAEEWRWSSAYKAPAARPPALPR